MSVLACERCNRYIDTDYFPLEEIRDCDGQNWVVCEDCASEIDVKDEEESK